MIGVRLWSIAGGEGDGGGYVECRVGCRRDGDGG
jgi:hypothetical protein